MRKMVITLLALGVFAASAAFAGTQALRFSQIYAGGGSGTGTYAPDYVELYNNSCFDVDISGWQIQYGSATGLFASNTTTIATLPAGSIIKACGYFLAQTGSSAVGPPPLPVTPDFVNTPGPGMSASAGKVALCLPGTATNLACAAMKAVPPVDLVGWGTANCFSGTAATPTPSNVIIAVRNGGGTVDNDQDLADWTNVSAPLVTMHNKAGGYLNPACELACFGGACCLRGGAGCVLLTAAQCAAVPLTGIPPVAAVFLGIGVPCNPTPCAVPTTKTTWGQVKTIYR